MNITRAKEILGRQVTGKSDQEIAGYIQALGQIAAIAAREAVKQFSLNETQDLLITRKDAYHLTEPVEPQVRALNYITL